MDSEDIYQQWTNYLNHLYYSQLYTNQYYSQTLNTQQQNTKIHFNPKFINAMKSEPQYHSVPQSASNIVSHKSKYSLVRNKSTAPIQTTRVEPTISTVARAVAPKTSFKISKYKCININNLRSETFKKPEPIKEPTKKTISIRKSKYKIEKKIIKTSPSPPIRIKDKYKYVKNQASTNNSSKAQITKKPIINYRSRYAFSRNRTASLNRSILNTSIKKIKPIRGKLKINNLPCPLFRKFGKCIRNKCEYQHDRKHVSVCRKFIKGLCHDKTCLLSHELSTNKLPTCYFYLNGICTKDNCPYLHVKLSDNATICKSFLKGYCEKGKDCLQRHVSEIRKKTKCGAKNRNIVLKINHKAKTIERNARSQLETNKSLKVCANKVPKEEPSSRYYEKQSADVKKVEETDDQIKPSRCKLGSLPSFIKF